jgi:hypothetical protein
MEACQWRRHRIRLRLGLQSYRSTPSNPVKNFGPLEAVFSGPESGGLATERLGQALA